MKELRFFQRAILAHNLISAQQEKKDEEEDNGQQTSGSNKNRIHPLVLAEARIESLGVSELTKSINLGTLVGTDYFGLANIVSQQEGTAVVTASKPNKANDNNQSEDKKKDSGAATKTDHTAKHQLLDKKLRATFLLKRKRSQLLDAAETLELHKRRLENSLNKQKLIDRRYLQLRKQWRLAAPEHGTVVCPVRPNEVIAIDVETYDRVGAGTFSVPNEARRRLARMVPRYATIEIEPHYSKDNNKLGKEETSPTSSANHPSEQTTMAIDDGDKVKTTDEVALLASQNISCNDNESAVETTATLESVAKLAKKLNLITKAEPYAVADPTLGKLDLEFDPDKVPIWTLRLSLTKNSNGFTVSSTLSPTVSTSESENEANTIGSRAARKKGSDERNDWNIEALESGSVHKDERVIQALQHSLFCASIFDAIRHEICAANTSTATMGGPTSGGTSRPPTVWISSGTKEIFFPQKSLMANGSGFDPSRVGRSEFCVAYCQEGEVAVQLDTEYLLTIKLIEVGTAADASKKEMRFCNQSSEDGEQEDESCKQYDSGSQTPAQLRALCRALLLHVQFLYHDFRRKTPAEKKVPMPTVPRKVDWCARILEKCVGFGSKFIFETKIRAVLQRTSSWLKKHHPSELLQVERLPLSLFDTHSYFGLSIGSSYNADIHITGASLCLTIFLFGDSGRHDAEHPYQKVSFASDTAFEQYLKFAIKRILA